LGQQQHLITYGKSGNFGKVDIKNGPITNSKRRATDIENEPVFAKPLLSELGHPQRGIRTVEYLL